MDTVKTINIIKQCALFRKAWHADEYKISDVYRLCKDWFCYPCGVDNKGRAVLCCQMSFPDGIPPVEQFIPIIFYMMDDIHRVCYEASQKTGKKEPIKDFCVFFCDIGKFSYTSLDAETQKYSIEIFTKYYPCFMSTNNIFISDDPNFTLEEGINAAVCITHNTPLYLRALWAICSIFCPKRWSSLMWFDSGHAIPDCIDRSIVPTMFGGDDGKTTEQWFSECAQLDNCSLSDEPRQLVSKRILEQFGQNLNLPANQLQDSIVHGYLWKKTNSKNTWHHYYFVLLPDGLFYYFKSETDSQPQNGLLLEGCSIVLPEEEEDKKREGISSINISKMVLNYKNQPGHNGEEESEGSKHNYFFILRTISRDYVFACNTQGQRNRWMWELNHSIQLINNSNNSIFNTEKLNE
ncbi:hypothetical protein WA158_002690 [Blastocystis sp. Blastoise]